MHIWKLCFIFLHDLPCLSPKKIFFEGKLRAHITCIQGARLVDDEIDEEALTTFTKA